MPWPRVPHAPLPDPRAEGVSGAAAADTLVNHWMAAARAALPQGDAAGVRHAARQALALGRAGGADPQHLGEACLYDAMAASLLLDHAAAYQSGLEAERLLPRHCHALRARALNVCFVVCAETGDLHRALDHSARAMSLARAGGDLHGVARMLHNRGSLLQRLGDHEEAVRSLDEAVALLATLQQGQGDLQVTRINLAEACLDSAARLAQQGQPAAAAQHRRRAADALPALGPDGDDAPPRLEELSGLHTWVKVQAQLGRLDLARRGLRRYLKVARWCGRTVRHRANALLALAAYHQHTGRSALALRCQQAAIERLSLGGNGFHAVDAQERLARMHADCGQHALALQWLRAARAERTSHQADQAALRWRLATLERQALRRRADLEEHLVHAQRLAVVGRLMSDIHHSLGTPIALVHITLARCEERASPQALVVALRRVIAQVDQAADLARQLRMFSYRAAPQAMVVVLHDSLREAWDGVALWRRGRARELVVTGDLATPVRVDVQRLAVLLRILLIEAGKAAPAALAVHISCGRRCGRMELSRELPAAAGAVAAGSAAPAGPGVGLTLCQEIAHEMGGRLTYSAGAEALPGFVLELPLA
jgi:tetratricopeptide (TPR) repeat protein